ncbi:hypothetical protein R1flu_027272 [Riccia fluitans]|uniref:Uncharacterized protein n=1 Tax=Riccia fluitans TaxID=41844 RepID=A0ABD1XIW1_9MARC
MSDAKPSECISSGAILLAEQRVPQRNPNRTSESAEFPLPEFLVRQCAWELATCASPPPSCFLRRLVSTGARVEPIELTNLVFRK